MDLLLTFQETKNYTFKDKLHKYIFWKVNYFQTWVRKHLLDFDTTCSVEILQQASWGQTNLVCHLKFVLPAISRRICKTFNRHIQMRSKKGFELIVTSKYTWLVMIKTPQRR